MIADGVPSPASGAAARTAAFGAELIEVHDELRRSLRRLRAEIGSPDGTSGERARTLRAHCAGFCSALTRHHASEDRTAFPALAAQVPELAAVLGELQRDHELMAGILRRVEQLADDAGPGSLPDAGSELDGLAAVLESHFRWEERRIASALSALDLPGATAADLFGAPFRAG